MEFFRNPNIDFLGKKWYFLAFSLVFSVAGVWSMLFWHHIPLGIDFRGGTQVEVKFTHTAELTTRFALPWTAPDVPRGNCALRTRRQTMKS